METQPASNIEIILVSFRLKDIIIVIFIVKLRMERVEGRGKKNGIM